MVDSDAILSVDQGTTSSRAIVFNRSGEVLVSDQQSFPQLFPAEDRVEHDPEAIWSTVRNTARRAFGRAEASGARIAGIGITNQRETVVVWDRATGEAVYPAIVWQDRRTAARCRQLSEAGNEDFVIRRAGLVIDPYFSATKIAWILDSVPGARRRADAGELCAGTIDSFLIYRMTGGRAFLTDATNACRTSLFDIDRQCWDEDLCRLFDVPIGILPEVRDCAGHFGEAEATFLGRPVPILAVAGDQQAAAVGQACFSAGDLKSTYGTGCFIVANTGTERRHSTNRLLSTVAYRLGGETTYAIEGSIFIAGAAVQWLRDEVGILTTSAETAERAARAKPDAKVVMVPAFAGMGAPHWSPDARAAVFGMTRGTGPDELSRAALEGVVFQTQDLLSAMQADGIPVSALKIDGGMAANDWFCQALANLTDRPVDRPSVIETTALGVSFLAGMAAGFHHDLTDVAETWRRERRFEPAMARGMREQRLHRWRACVAAVLSVAAAEG